MGEAKRRKLAGDTSFKSDKSGYTMCGFVAICKHPRNWGAITTLTLLVPNENIVENRNSVLTSVFEQKLSKDFPMTSFMDWDGILLAPKVEQTLDELKAAVDLVAIQAANVNREQIRKQFGDTAAATYNTKGASDWQDVWAENAVVV